MFSDGFRGYVFLSTPPVSRPTDNAFAVLQKGSQTFSRHQKMACHELGSERMSKATAAQSLTAKLQGVSSGLDKPPYGAHFQPKPIVDP